MNTLPIPATPGGRGESWNENRLTSSKGERTTFFILFFAGMALCGLGGISQATVRGWLHPISLVGYSAGALLLLLGVCVFLKRRVGPVTNGRTAILALIGLMAFKVAAATVYPLF